MLVTKNSRLNYRIQHLIFIILLLGCIGFAGWLSNEYDIRSDWTAGKRHSLSEETLQLLDTLSSPVKVRSYQTNDPALNQAINEILLRYQNNTSDFSFQLINPDIFIEQAKADGIQRYGQSVIEYQGQLEHIDSINEESLSNALLRLQRKHKPNLLFVANHNERNINDNSDYGYSTLALQLTNKGFNSLTINLLDQALPKKSNTDENNVLIIGSIQTPLLVSEQEKILDFIKAGGNLLWLQDPQQHSSLKTLQDALQINFVAGTLVDNNPEISRMLKLSHPAMIPVLEYKMHPITEKMKYFTLFTVASAIMTSTEQSADTSQSWIHSDLLISSEDSWAETGDLASIVEFNPAEDTQGPLTLGIAQQRQIEINQQLIAQRVVVIGDTDFLSNSNIGHGANLDFITKTMNWLAEDDRLITISPKTAPDLTLKLSATYTSIIGIFFLIGLPVILFSSGAYIWFKRRKQ